MRYSDAYTLHVCEEAESDLDDIYDIDEDAGATIEVFLQEVRGNQDMLDRLSSSNYRSYGDNDFDVKRWIEAWRTMAVWRIRVYNCDGAAKNYRVIFTFHPIEKRYYILGVVPRDFDYDPNHQLSKRIASTYSELGIP